LALFQHPGRLLPDGGDLLPVLGAHPLHDGLQCEITPPRHQAAFHDLLLQATLGVLELLVLGLQ